MKKAFQNSGFNDKGIDWTNIGHGCYAINSNGWAFSHKMENVNNQQRSFMFDIGDVIFMEYESKTGVMTF